MINLYSTQASVPAHDDTEKRKYKRVDRSIIIRFRARPENKLEMTSSKWDMVGVNDLGVGGLFFNSSSNIRSGTVLDLKIGFSTSLPPVDCTGIVTRVKKQPNTSIFGIAAIFIDIPEYAKDLIHKHVNQTSPAHLALTY